MENCKISPSIFAGDLENINNEIKRIDQSSCDMIHIDIMDGKFVKNSALSFDDFKIVAGTSKKYIDIHLMEENPVESIDFIKTIISDGVITIHYEIENCVEILRHIKELGFSVGIAIKPKTDIIEFCEFLIENKDLIDLVLVMSVEPGFSGQTFIENSIQRVGYINNCAIENELSIFIEVDGGVNTDNSSKLIAAGANILVAGSYIFKSDNYENSINALRV